MSALPDPEALAELLAQPPAKVTTTVWSRFSWSWKAIPNELPDGTVETVYSLFISDPDTGDRHRFNFSQNARDSLLAQMTGGLHLP